MVFGYGRVSTRDQNTHLQEDALTQAGCERIFTEKISGSAKVRPELEKLKGLLRPGDTVAVWRLDRLGRSLVDLVEIINHFRELGVGFQCLTMAIDTETASGRLMYNLFASLAEFERDLISERTHAGLVAARARGRVGGRPKGLSKEADKKATYVKLLYSDGNSISSIMTMVGVKSKETIYRWLRAKGVAITQEEKQAKLISQQDIKMTTTI